MKEFAKQPRTAGITPPEERPHVDESYYILTTSSLIDERTKVLKNGDTFAVFDRYGDVRHGGIGEQGIYHEGTRFLSQFELRLERKRPLLLGSHTHEDNQFLSIDLSNPDFYTSEGTLIPRGSLHLSRTKFLGNSSCYEQIRIANFAAVPLDVDLSIFVDADFVDIFEVRGMKRSHRGEIEPVQRETQELLFGYRGLDGIIRRSRMQFQPVGDYIEQSWLHFSLHVPPHGEKALKLSLSFEIGETDRHIVSYEKAWETVSPQRSKKYPNIDCEIMTSNDQFNGWIRRSMADFQMMLSTTPYGQYPYAGVPWFCTPFGRDGIISALETLWIHPQVSQGVLNFLDHYQATELEPARDAEPGKILHEMRKGEMAALGEIPFGRYYGSIDSTPLFLILAGTFYERTGNKKFLMDLWPKLEAAFRWIDEFGDLDGDGFVEYLKKSEEGLLHQGWKDSQDAIFHADETDAEPPIALCEVQAYVYAAKKAFAKLAKALDFVEQATEIERQAESLKIRFNESFWCETIGMYALALDKNKQPCRVRSSNAGQCLFSGIASKQQARRMVEAFMGDNFFSGWGIRTISTQEKRYNPMSYHNGTIWPHDNALIAYGFSHYGYKSEVVRILTALYESSLYIDSYRLPELLCGFPRQAGQGPTLYPVACSPQSWSSGCVFLLLQACLGIKIDAVQRKVIFEYPVLPEYIEFLSIRNLQVGDASLDLALHRHPEDVGVNVLRRHGDIEVVTVK